MVEEVEKEEKKEESWVTSKWRPCMRWLYMVTCAFDFILGPILWAFLQTVTKQTVTQWMPLTLQGGEMWAPLGWTIIGGLLVSTILTLIVIPVLYHAFESANEKTLRKVEG